MNIRRALMYPLLERRTPTRIFHLAAAAIVVAGAVLRIVLLVQNRNLIIDEANIVRNLAERDFAGLLRPLDYEQYAPPLWLWMQEGISLVAGFGEVAMRAFSTICGIAALGVMWRIGLRILSPRSLWVPLGILAFAPPFVRYSAEIKQYGCDVLVTLLLVLAATRWTPARLSPRGLLLRWGVAGTLALWTSMPAIFVLAGIGLMLFLQSWKGASRRYLAAVLAVGAVWLAAFALYYAAVLHAQIGSDYLQNYHRDYFLFAWPNSADEWRHNRELLKATLSGVTGWDARWRFVSGLLMLLGTAWAIKNQRVVVWAVVTPAVLVLIAAALKQYSLIERVALFLYPLGLVVLGVGFERVLRIRFLPLQLAALLFGAVVLKTYQWFDILEHRFEFHELTPVLGWVQAKGGTGGTLLVHDATTPTYRYYTMLHPRHTRFENLLGARLLAWDTDYGAMATTLPDTTFLVFTGGSEADREARLDALRPHLAVTDSMQHAYGYGYRMLRTHATTAR